ncbi:MAG: LptF/LptG family permease [Planctomycetes bacterium]|nr:LptF/LptG family permease [Planctomycetota bacterium]
MRLERYVLAQLAFAFFVAAAGILFIATPAMAVSAVHKLSGVGTLAVLSYLPLVLAGFIPYATPVSLLLALVSVYGRLAADREWTAIQMAGVSPWRMIRPALLVAGVVGALALVMNAEVLPRMKYEQKAYQIRALRDAVRNLSPGRTELSFGEFYLTARSRDGDVFRDAFIQVPETEESPARNFLAGEVEFTFDYERMHVALGDVQHVQRDDEEPFELQSEEAILSIPFAALVDRKDPSWTGARYQRSSELMAALEAGELRPKDERHYRWEFHQRIAQAASCLVFALLGASTGLLLRRGTRMAALAVAVGYALAYWLIALRLGKELAISGDIPAALGAWSAVLLTGTVGVILTRKAFSR